MVKYIFYILLGIFLISVVSTSDDMKEYKMPHAIGAQYSFEHLYSLSKTDFKHRDGVHSGYYSCKAENANIGNLFSFHCIAPTKILRNNAAFNAIRFVKCLKILLPEDKTPSFPFTINSFKFSCRYYVYTLRRILI